MTLHFCGYFPKQVTPRPEGYDLPGVVEIASVSECIAKGPEDWIQSWVFNELGFFDSADLAESIVPATERARFDIYAYEFLGQRFASGAAEAWAIPRLPCQPPGADFEPLGFDAVSKTSSTSFFEHSPLSCNGKARDYPTNAQCLFDSLDAAIAAAQAFSKPDGKAEPGSYYVVRVSRRRRAPV